MPYSYARIGHGLCNKLANYFDQHICTKAISITNTRCFDVTTMKDTSVICPKECSIYCSINLHNISSDSIVWVLQVQVVKRAARFIVSGGAYGGKHLGVVEWVDREVKHTNQSSLSAVTDEGVTRLYQWTFVQWEVSCH